MTVLAVRSLSKSFGGVHAVNEASFDVGAGEFLAMIGPNGAGKSTCFNMIHGQLAPDAGEILLDGENIAGLAPRAVWRRGDERGAHRHGQPFHQQRRAVGAEAEISGVAERVHAAGSGDEMQAHGEDHRDQHVDAEDQNVGIGFRE
jgi:ABC-type branched-subunit amino acid transport system ATPase component